MMFVLDSEKIRAPLQLLEGMQLRAFVQLSLQALLFDAQLIVLLGQIGWRAVDRFHSLLRLVSAPFDAQRTAVKEVSRLFEYGTLARSRIVESDRCVALRGIRRAHANASELRKILDQCSLFQLVGGRANDQPRTFAGRRAGRRCAALQRDLQFGSDARRRVNTMW